LFWFYLVLTEERYSKLGKMQIMI